MATNKDRPSGLTPIGTLTGADWRGKLRRVAFASGDAVACFIGDRVKLTGTADATGKLPIVAQAALTDAAIGVLVSLEPDGTDEGSLTKIYRVASTARTASVVMGGDVLYSCQEDSVGNSITVDEVGLNAEIVVGTGSTLTGISGSEIDSTSAAGTSTLAVRIHHLVDRPDNELGTNAEWAVTLNDYQGDRQQTGI
jgi:hypothetical protein